MPPVFWIIIRAAAAATLPAIEALAIEYLLKNKGELQGKADRALDYAMEQYRRMTAGNRFLDATTIDDEIVRAQLKRAIQEAFDRAPDAVKQAAREVREALPTPAAPGEVTDPIDVSKWKPGPEPGVPLTDADFGKE